MCFRRGKPFRKDVYMINTISIEQVRFDTRLYTNLVYATVSTNSAAAIPLHFHIILPRGGKAAKFPLIIYVGGGGWQVSSPERHIPEMTHFAERGFVVASIEYRTTSYSRFPAQIEDIKTAIRFFRKNCEQFHIDPDKIHMIGGSAGAYLTAMAALTGGTKLFRGSDNLEYPDILSSAICLYGVFDFTSIIGNATVNAGNKAVELFLPSTKEEALIYASPISYINSTQTPFLLLHGTHDNIVDCEQSIRFHNLLEEAKVPANLYLINNAAHADPIFSQPHVQQIIEEFINKA